MEEGRSAFIISTGKPTVKRPLGSHFPVGLPVKIPKGILTMCSAYLILLGLIILTILGEVPPCEIFCSSHCDKF